MAIGKKSNLAEEITRSKRVDLTATPPTQGLAFEQDEELPARFVLTNEFFPCREIELVRDASDR